MSKTRFLDEMASVVNKRIYDGDAYDRCLDQVVYAI